MHQDCWKSSRCVRSYGTALGVIREAVESGKKIRVLPTRRTHSCKGAHLTAWELVQGVITIGPGFRDFLDNSRQGTRNLPAWIMGPDLAQIAVVADMIATTVQSDVRINLPPAGQRLDQSEHLENGAGVLFAAA